MKFDGFRLTAIPHIMEAACRKCHNYCVEVPNGFLSSALFCPKCEIVYQLKMVAVPRSKVDEEYLQQCRESAPDNTGTKMIQKTHSEECWKWHLECAVARVEKLSAEYSELREKYHDLLYQVGKKWPGESRHDTAKRYIREADTPCAGCRGDSDTHICHEQCKSAAPSTQQKSKPTNP